MIPEQTVVSLKNAEIAYYDLPAQNDNPEGPKGDILLVHGFASSANFNWLMTGWTSLLQKNGYRAIALDNRGHGNSQKFYDPADYGPDIFANDAFDLLDHLGIERCPVLGFSMGARITCWMAHERPERVDCAIFGGMGSHIFGNRGGYGEIAEALETDDLTTITDPGALSFRKFAERTGSDSLALAACIRPSKHKITPDIVAGINVPVLVAVGDKDDVGGSAPELAALMPNAKGVELEGLDHMRSTGATSFKDATLEFLKSNHHG